MAKFNEKQNNNVVNLAGGKAYNESKEMRDVFYENFKNLIEKCKELL